MSIRVWLLTLFAMLIVILVDLYFAWKQMDREKTAKRSILLTFLYVSSAILFGYFMVHWTSSVARTGFYATWLTEYSLSFDNLFVFSLIFTRLNIVGKRQEIFLYLGIAFSYVLRAISLITGIALVDSFKFMFAIFGALLLYTGIQLLREDSDTHWEEGRLLRYLHKRRVPLSGIAIFAIGFSDLMFALDSIPASIGVTTDKYVILTANFFALLGLRQLYFVVDKLIKRLTYLSLGLSAILVFIGLKLILESFDSYGVEKIGSITLPVITVQQSMVVIASILSFSVAASLYKTQRPDFPL